MKRSMLLLCILCLLLICAACGNNEAAEPGSDTDPAAEEITVGVVCHAALVNVRLEPDADSRIISTALRGMMFQVLDYNEEDEWHHIICGGDTAYINGAYLSVTKWEKGSSVTIGTVYGTDGVVSVFAEKNTGSAQVIGALKGEQFLVTQNLSDQGWYKVSTPDGGGYIRAEYLRTKTDSIENLLS